MLLALVAVGRWEASRHADGENRAIARVVALVGPLDRPPPSFYRTGIGPGLDCLLWRRGTNRFALELCFTADGRVAEAIDRRHGEPKIASLREDPGRATTRIDIAAADRLLRKLGAPGT
ncbi:MAG: hypothetical protein QOE36_1316 [Gaiellaceae bacterium]|nr:hypothetical protein [Gaiellaceae bacterium]